MEKRIKRGEIKFVDNTIFFYNTNEILDGQR